MVSRPTDGRQGGSLPRAPHSGTCVCLVEPSWRGLRGGLRGLLALAAGRGAVHLKYASAQTGRPPQVILSITAAAEKDQGRVERTRPSSTSSPTASWAAIRRCLPKLRSGAINFLTYLDGNLSTLVPALGDRQRRLRFQRLRPSLTARWTAQLGALVRADNPQERRARLRSIWDNGFRQITTAAKPIVHPDDLSGLKIRVPVSPIEVSLFHALGARADALNFSEVYTALQTHVVDGKRIR